jgi:hypothetical protein
VRACNALAKEGGLEHAYASGASPIQAQAGAEVPGKQKGYQNRQSVERGPHLLGHGRIEHDRRETEHSYRNG